MTNIVDKQALSRAITKTVNEDMNTALDQATDEVIQKLRAKVRRVVAVNMIALCQSDYSMEYMRDQLVIKVNIGDLK